MVGAGRAGIIAVVGCYHEEVRWTQRFKDRLKAVVEPLEVGGIAGDIVPMAVHRIEIHRLLKIKPSGVSVKTPCSFSRPSASLAVGSARVMPLPAKRSLTLPMETTGS